MKNFLTIVAVAFAFVANAATAATAPKTKVFVKNDTVYVETSNPEINSAVYDTRNKKWVAAVQVVDDDMIVWSTTKPKATRWFLKNAMDLVADYGCTFAIKVNSDHCVRMLPVKVVYNN